MRTYPEDKYDLEEAVRLKAPKWMLDTLKLNPEYVFWGPHEDYMIKDKGWDGRVFIKTWKNFDWNLNDLNEVVNFYFRIDRETEECAHCEQTGYNPETKVIADTWYSFGEEEWINIDSGRRFNNRAWQYHLTQHEVDALWEHNRLKSDFKSKPTADEVNEWNKKGLGHDAINRSICIRARAEKLGVYGTCPHCNGYGCYFITNKCKLQLILWFIHPRKGCSRGVEISDIGKGELAEAIEYLKEAARRNSDRFSKL